MNILVYPNELKIGGSAINAIDLGGAMRQLGHSVVVYATPGPLAELVERRSVRLITEAYPPRPRPSPAAMRSLRRIVRSERIDLVHAYEHYACMESYYAAHLACGVPMVGTILSADVEPSMPRSITLTVGTQQLKDQLRRRGEVILLEPPIDTRENSPAFDGSAFRAEHGLDDGAVNVVIASRFTRYMKAEGLYRVIDAVAGLAARLPLRLILVGYGRCYDDFVERADAINADVGRRAVVLTGAMVDPRPAYAVADITVGMGSSILRGMAFAKPSIVVGEQGFSEVFGPDTVEMFLRDGFYGLGDGDTSPARLARQLEELCGDAARRAELGAFARQVVLDRFDLHRRAAELEQTYRALVARGVRTRDVLPEAAQTAGRILYFDKLKPRVARRNAAAAR